jgi:hypothetical protein
MPPGSLRGLQLVVSDAEVARTELQERGVECSEIVVLTTVTAAPSSASPTQTATPGRSNKSRPEPISPSSPAPEPFCVGNSTHSRQ